MFSSRANASAESEFWSWFQRNEESLFDFEKDQERTFDRLATEMRKLHPNLTFEFGPQEKGRREFVISADGIREAFPAVERLFMSAPKLRRWTFIKFRPRREAFDLNYKGLVVRAADVSMVLKRDGTKVGITVLIPGCSAATYNQYLGLAFLFLDQALGEYDVETRVSHIAVQAPTTGMTGAVPLGRVPAAFDALLAGR
jgi:hypothetical protein